MSTLFLLCWEADAVHTPILLTLHCFPFCLFLIALCCCHGLVSMDYTALYEQLKPGAGFPPWLLEDHWQWWFILRVKFSSSCLWCHQNIDLKVCRYEPWHSWSWMMDYRDHAAPWGSQHGHREPPVFHPLRDSQEDHFWNGDVGNKQFHIFPW